MHETPLYLKAGPPKVSFGGPAFNAFTNGRRFPESNLYIHAYSTDSRSDGA